MKYTVSWGKSVVFSTGHGTYETFEGAFQSIQNWWKQNDFEPPYIRYWREGAVVTIDYGNHHFFYFIEEVTE